MTAAPPVEGYFAKPGTGRKLAFDKGAAIDLWRRCGFGLASLFCFACGFGLPPYFGLPRGFCGDFRVAFLLRQMRLILGLIGERLAFCEIAGLRRAARAPAAVGAVICREVAARDVIEHPPIGERHPPAVERVEAGNLAVPSRSVGVAEDTLSRGNAFIAAFEMPPVGEARFRAVGEGVILIKLGGGCLAPIRELDLT